MTDKIAWTNSLFPVPLLSKNLDRLSSIMHFNRTTLLPDYSHNPRNIARPLFNAWSVIASDSFETTNKVDKSYYLQRCEHNGK